ncbi:MAG: class I SAM-dependent methyltransferase [Fimbriimonadaceae bacterium]|nr:class I SAM-dependent methyltransferase [Fimbriimonadaceae bacterium]
MRPTEHARMFAFEDHYWWFVGRQAILASLLDQHLTPADLAHRRIVDVGCGSGATLRLLQRYGQAVGVDPFRSALTLSQSRGLPCLVQADATRLPLAAGSVHLATALDVLEHIADDRAAAAEVARMLRPGGQFLLTVPAYQFLWSQHDEALDHFRRYTARQVRALVEGAGLRVQRLGYCISLLLPAAVALRLGQRLRRRSPSEPHCALIELPPLLNRLCLATLQAEAWLLRHVELPAGVSVVCLAQRP